MTKIKVIFFFFLIKEKTLLIYIALKGYHLIVDFLTLVSRSISCWFVRLFVILSLLFARITCTFV